MFATNLLQIIVQPGNPLGITGVADLAAADLLYVTCAPEVPIGKYRGAGAGGGRCHGDPSVAGGEREGHRHQGDAG